MAQQPNVRITDADRPRRSLQPPASRRWRAHKPGVPDAPNDPDRFGPYDVVGPDPGWAVKVVRRFELPDEPGLEEVVTGLVMARAAALGRAAVRSDVEAVLALLGYDHEAPPEVVERRRRWLAAVPYDKRPGETAVMEVDRQLLVESPEHIKWAQHHRSGRQ
ncbi:MAG TPA: hypothetical protein VF246_09085 [Acidimicrobiia bacterium]